MNGLVAFIYSTWALKGPHTSINSAKYSHSSEFIRSNLGLFLPKDLTSNLLITATPNNWIQNNYAAICQRFSVCTCSWGPLLLLILSSSCLFCSICWKDIRLFFRSSSLVVRSSAASCWDPAAPSSLCWCCWSAVWLRADKLATFCSISRNISCRPANKHTRIQSRPL